ncbi:MULTISPECIES: CADD family putative folate metabolism protein [spotted fever group]|uniref:Coenzyme PQQ biosynthesis protein C n=1 Tax=Rickettsia tamurae subsp. buchneri TaxID=1462938 RepID=A0A8E1C002_9RICK|nr:MULTISPECIES: CADD family putative folate metabolism protein [spotted fever group]EER22753.1 tena/thi-4 family protein [Rickettsia endosymbiont of Ixodes scapularis]KDO03079.1 Coenzyme PQQ biosynthesis protein C [Rickettsia tamurae subsp. buchneri]
MKFLEQLNIDLERYNLLNHPFYQLWNMGKLTYSTLQIYAKEYYHHVTAFPRYISAIHSKCSDIQARQILLGNLIEEEQGEENHPELWKRFAEGLGCLRNQLTSEPKLDSTQKLVQGYFKLTEKSFSIGLGALYAYERQTPEVSDSKIQGLQKFYGISDYRTLQFFIVHNKVDQWHAQECANLINNLSSKEQKLVYQGAIKGAKLLWQFLDGINTTYQ